MKIISNCPLCEKHALHVIGENETQTQQCINCGYVTSEKLKLNGMLKQDSEEYKKLTGEMQKWSTVKNDRIWLPTMMILPFGMLYPIGDKNGELQWAFSEMVDIPEEEQKKYPREDGKGFHNKRMDTDNAKIYDLFHHRVLYCPLLSSQPLQYVIYQLTRIYPVYFQYLNILNI